MHLILVDRQIFRSTAYKFLHCLPSASPAHEKQKTRQYFVTFNYFYY
jgi:hypothetical protein